MTEQIQRVCDALDRAVQAVCRWILYLTMVSLFGALSINVLLRYVAGTSLKWAGELPELMEIRKGGQTLIGFPALIDRGDHVEIEVFDEPAFVVLGAGHELGVDDLALGLVATHSVSHVAHSPAVRLCLGEHLGTHFWRQRRGCWPGG